MDIRQTLRDWRAGMNLLGLQGDNVNWQSIAVMLHNITDEGKIDYLYEQLLDRAGGWSTFGNRRESSGTSLYLSPKGMAYWLYYGGHDSWYWSLCNLGQGKLDRSGWLHISGGRVDVHCRMSAAQQRWLKEHKPAPNSENAHNGEWYIKPYEAGHDERAPKPYVEAEPYDVRPVDNWDTDEGWELLMLRISQAKHRTAGQE